MRERERERTSKRERKRSGKRERSERERGGSEGES